MSNEPYINKHKRPRLPGSDGSPSPGPGPFSSSPPSMNHDHLAEKFIQTLSEHVKANSPAKDEYNLACPFLKHDPDRYAYVKNSCTTTGFKDVGSLRDHIKRVHSRRYGCIECSHRFNCGKKQLGSNKAKHQKDCKEQKKKTAPRSERLEPEWMTEEQEKEYEKLDLRRSRKENPEDSFREIYTHLWPESRSDESSIPDYRHGPGFLVSMYIIEEAFKNFFLGPERSSSPDRHPSQVTDVDNGPIQQQPEIGGIVNAAGFYSSYINDLPEQPAFISYHDPDPNPPIYGNSQEGYLTGNYSQSQFNNHSHNRSSSSINSDQYTISPICGPATQATESRVAPFDFIVPSTNRSNYDSAYGGTNPSDESESYQPRQLPPAPQQQQHHAALQADDPGDQWALNHTMPNCPEYPFIGDDCLLDEEDKGGYWGG